MSFLTNLTGRKTPKIHSYGDFWTWFQSKERSFYKVVRNRGDFERDFFKPLSTKLSQLRDGYFFLTGMLGDHTAELVFTADGRIKNFVFVEELVQSAPMISGWKFTAHKPAHNLEDVNIEMAGFKFNGRNLSFRPVEHHAYPDEIEIVIIHPDLNDHNRNEITNGVYIFLDHYLGEINFATIIDYLNVEGSTGDKESIPINKLRDYLTWREKEFVEKYDGIRRHTENDTYSGLEGRLENGNRLIATVNAELLRWNSTASHPWILKVEIRYNDAGGGMPDEKTYELMHEFENAMNDHLKDANGYLYIGRQTGESVREIFFACRDFRTPSKVTSDLMAAYSDRLNISYDIYKDKYWKTFERFTGA